MGENLLMNKLIVMDDVSGLAGKSTHFSNFLTISRKYGFTCVYVFHTIYPNRQNQEMVMSQMHIFNFFPGSIHNSKILKTLSLFANQQKTLIYLRDRFGLINFIMKYLIEKKKKCLTVDTRDINEFGPGNLEHLLESNKRVIFTKIIAIHISKVLFHSVHKLNEQHFLFLKRNLTLIFQIKTSIFLSIKWKI